jgi:SAM-dependent methyltransferase
MGMASECFDDLTDVYEAMINWPKRLANEEPFFRRLVERFDARRVVDVACGTGRHAAMFHSWGLQVEGSDVSASMIERAQADFGQSPGLRWKVRGFDEPIESADPVDLVICVGNSLALAPDEVTAASAIRQMLHAVREGGGILVHLLNLWHLPDGPVVWQKCLRTTLSQGEVLIVKGVHRCGTKGYVDLVVTSLGEGVTMQSESAQLLGLEAAELEHLARGAGARNVELFGNYRETPYDRRKSMDLLMVAEK